MFSKQTAVCGHCGVKLRRDRLKEHSEKHHSGKPIFEKSGGDITSFFQKSSCSSLQSSSSQVSFPLKRACPAETDKVQQSDLGTSKKAATSDTIETPSETEFQAAEFSTQEEKLDSIHKEVRELKKVVNAIHENVSSVRTAKPAPNEQAKHVFECDMNKILLRQAKTVDKLCNLAPFLTKEDDLGCFACSLCLDTYQDRDKHSHDIQNGVIRYNFEEGVDFSDRKQPIAFRNLKTRIIEHIDSQTHRNAQLAREEASAEQKKKSDRNMKVGMVLARTAYKIVKLGQSYANFETEVSLLHMNGVDVGDINHSRKFASQIVSAIFDVAVTKVKQVIRSELPTTGRPRPVGLLADKLTKKHRTGHIVGIVLPMPEREVGQDFLVPLYLDMPIVKEHSGRALAEQIIAVIQDFGVSPQQVNGGSFDGQYFSLKVPEHIHELLNISPDWCTFIWDIAHRLNLADHDIRKSPDFTWLVKMTDLIGTAFSKVSYGKSYEHLLSICSDLKVKLKAPTSYSDTRFAAFVHRVYEKFLRRF